MRRLPPLLPNHREKRNFLRVSNLFGEVLIHDGDDLFRAYLNNIGTDGIYIDYLDFFPEGSSVKIVIKSGLLQEPIQLTGLIVRIEEGRGTAIEFTSYFGNAKEVIQVAVFSAIYKDRIEKPRMRSIKEVTAYVKGYQTDKRY